MPDTCEKAMTQEELDYLSYLLRLWRVSDDESSYPDVGEAQQMEAKAVWRASLQSALDGERQSFASLEDLFRFLQKQTAARPGVRRQRSDSEGAESRRGLPPRRTEVFVLQVWAEYLDQTPPVWRGEIEYVGRREMVRFDDVDEMLECARRLVTKAKE